MLPSASAAATRQREVSRPRRQGSPVRPLRGLAGAQACRATLAFAAGTRSGRLDHTGRLRQPEAARATRGEGRALPRSAADSASGADMRRPRSGLLASGVTSVASGLTLHHLRRDAFGGTLGGEFVAAPQQARRRAYSLQLVRHTRWGPLSVPNARAVRPGSPRWLRSCNKLETRFLGHFRRFCPIYSHEPGDCSFFHVKFFLPLTLCEGVWL